ncbi:AfsA-related hotdog domain-containing protein [Frankia sp. Cj5]|uniref:AfsA-related hotdog domain-containing protein n=1 Tax=Frankia sp. Cj5 TaxID=2880978 RepID=UPI001EF49735|nr:AfsA-related hotdog domain-containing protein [Frankia sp. Cj5]
MTTHDFDADHGSAETGPRGCGSRAAEGGTLGWASAEDNDARRHPDAASRTVLLPEPLSFEQTVPRAIAHRRAVGEVFVTDSRQLADDDFLCAIQLPRGHSLWADRARGFHDPFAAAEGARQSAFVVLHRYLGVPVGLPFSMQRFAFEVLDLAAFQDDERWPLAAVLRYRITNLQLRGGELGSLTLTAELAVDGAPAMTVSGDAVFMSRDDYEALRAFQRARKPIEPGRIPPPAAPIDPAEVGRRDVRNVVIGEPLEGAGDSGVIRHPVVIDRSHPAFFDHDYDHVPGPFLVEGFRQAAIVAALRAGLVASPSVAMAGLLVDFAGFGEFEAPLALSAVAGPVSAGGCVPVEVTLEQFDERIAHGRVDLRPFPGPVTGAP